MELNEYNGFADHCKSSEIDLKGKFEQKDSHGVDTMEQIMQRKEQEFIDHTLLAPEYMRDPNHFIMDLMSFPKTENGAHNNGETLSSDLHFHNSLFPVGTDDRQNANEPRKTVPNSVFIPLNNDFLMPVQKSYSTAVDSVAPDEDNGVKVVQQLLLTDSNVTLDDGSIDDDCFSSRKVLPHKKRISRKLKINHCDSDLQLNVQLDDHKMPHVDQLVVGAGGLQQFRCELCGHATCSQLDFFAHLKQHYEPSTPDTILAAMKTSLEVLSPEKNESDLCAIKKTDGLDQVFQDVHFPFENFTQAEEVVSVRVVMDPQLHQHQANTLADATMNVATTSLQPHNQSQQQQPAQRQQTAPNLVPEEFSDTEDMLEGIRDKVLIEDTCDTMDLMTPTSNGARPHWFTNNCFNGIDLKAKPFCDVLFSGQFAPILNNDSTVPLLEPEPHMPTGKLMQRELEQGTPELQPPDPAPSPPSLTQPVQNEADVRLQYPLSQPSLHSTEQCFVQEQHQTNPAALHRLNEQHMLQSQHIKIEETPPDINDIPYQNSEDTISGNEFEPEEGFHENEDTDDEFSSLLDKGNEYKFSYSIKTEDCSENVFDGNGEEFCSENDEDNEDNKRKRYICNKCQRIFNSRNALKYHNRTHSGLRPHQCEICDKSFFAIGALKAHTRTHTGDKPFECKHCDRKFRQWGDLKYHTVSIHSTEKNHQCEFCGKAFSRKYSLVVHLRIHTSERNYKCEFCTKTFRASTYLQNHRKIHTGEKPYECEVCSKRFRVSGDLRRHQRIHERKKQKQELLKKDKSEV